MAVAFAGKFGAVTADPFRILDVFPFPSYLFGVAFSVNFHDVKN